VTPISYALAITTCNGISRVAVAFVLNYCGIHYSGINFVGVSELIKFHVKLLKHVAPDRFRCAFWIRET
jgi:hypothetical protein